jgi:hypothetical protein
MSNTKVYLAKNILAGGLDVEYVKSHLSRIQGINIVENGMGFMPSECKSFVIIPDKDFDISEGNTVPLSKNVAKDLKEFIKNHTENEYPMNYVYVYTGEGDIECGSDAEISTPLVSMSYDGGFGVVDKDDFNHYAEIEIGEEEDQLSLLEAITTDIDAPSDCWIPVPRHHQPAPEFALPPPPTLEERRLRNMGTVKLSENDPNYYLEFKVFRLGRPLLLRKRRK